MTRQRAAVAVAIGAIFSVPLQFLVRELSTYLLSCCISDEGGPSVGYNSLYLASAAAALIPGFITGWVARQRGMLLGFLAGFIGSILFSNLPKFLWSVWQAGDASAFINFASSIVFTAAASGLYAGAAGGSAELLRAGVPTTQVGEAKPVRYGLLATGLLGIVSTWTVWWIYETLFPASYSEMSAGHSLSTYFLLAAANFAFIVTGLIGFAILLRSYFR